MNSPSAIKHTQHNTWDYDYSFDKISRILDLKSLSGKSVLDIGCGDGKLTKELVPYAATVLGIDIDTDALKIASQHGIRTIPHDLEQSLPFPDQEFDLVLCLDTIEHIYNASDLIKESARVLKPTCQLILAVPNHFQIRNRLRMFFGGGIIHWNHTEHSDANAWDYVHIRFPRLQDLKAQLEANRLYIHAIQLDFTIGRARIANLLPSPIRKWLVTTWPELFSGKFIVLAGKEPKTHPHVLALDSPS